MGQDHDRVLENIRSYWGGMLDRGASTFWEEYKPEEPEEEQYGMYGDKYGKSLCHAWGASPIYLIGRYFMGLRPTGVAYETFEVEPQLGIFGDFTCELPVNEGTLRIKLEANRLEVYTDKEGGRLRLGEETFELKKGEILMVEV